MTTFSDEIRKCRDGVVKNPYQGDDKKVVFVCSMGILRSATAARLYADKYNTRCAGSWDDALVPLTLLLISWADELVFVNKSNYDGACKKFGDLSQFDGTVRILDIPDAFPHMAPELVAAFEEQYEPVTNQLPQTA